MQFRLSHIFALTTYVAISLAAYLKLPQFLGATGVLGKLGIGCVELGVFICLFLTFLLRLDPHQRPFVQSDETGVLLYDGQHWLDYFFPWITGSVIVFGGSYSILSDISHHPIPENWWVSLIAAAALLAGYIPVWRYLRTV